MKIPSPKAQMAPKPEIIVLPKKTNDEYYEMTKLIASYFEKFKINCNDPYDVSCLCDRTIGFVNHIKNGPMKQIYKNHRGSWNDQNRNELDTMVQNEKYVDDDSTIEIVFSISKQIKRGKAGTSEAIQNRIVQLGSKAADYFKKPVEFIDKMKIINQNKRYLSRPRAYYVLNNGKRKPVPTNKYSMKNT